MIFERTYQLGEYTMELQEQVKIIQESERIEQIKKYTTECGCGFEFMPMGYWVKDGAKFCECGDCGEVILLD